MQSFGISDIGKTRTVNQDAFFLSDSPVGPLPNLFIIADGMGGHNAGEVASNQAVAVFCDYCRNYNYASEIGKNDYLDIMVSAANQANQIIYTQSMREPALQGMGTTFSACLLTENKIYIVHIGDSRVYRIGKGQINQLTHDHSYVNEMVKAGQLTENQAKKHPKKNILTRVLGVDVYMEVDGYTHGYTRGDVILLCSDGLTNMLSDNEILRITGGEAAVHTRVKALADAANEKGGKDNISVILINTTD